MRRRSPRNVVLGLVLAIACSLLFAGTALRTDPATPVLALARDVGAGQTIRDRDLKVVRIVPGDAVQLVGESQRETVVGRTAAVPLVAGSLLSPGQMGGSAFPPVGQSVIAVGVKAGKAPAGMAVGSRVTVLVVPPTGNGSAPAQPVRASATVSAIEVPDAAGLTAVSLLLSSEAALQVSVASGDVSLILQGSGG